MIDKKMKLTKDRFSTWENINDKDYEQEFDDELIIKVYPNESSVEIADYILWLQEELEYMTETNKTCANNCANMAVENTKLKGKLDKLNILILGIPFMKNEGEFTSRVVYLLGDKE